MIKCDTCGATSPYDAKFCIGCGKLIPDGTVANTGVTTRLSSEYKPSAIPTGAPYANPYLDYRDLNNKGIYYIYKADLGALLKAESVSVKETDRGYDIYYYGRKVVFMD